MEHGYWTRGWEWGWGLGSDLGSAVELPRSLPPVEKGPPVTGQSLGKAGPNPLRYCYLKLRCLRPRDHRHCCRLILLVHPERTGQQQTAKAIPNLKCTPVVEITRPASRWTMAAVPGTPTLQLPEGHALRRRTGPIRATVSPTLTNGEVLSSETTHSC